MSPSQGAEVAEVAMGPFVGEEVGQTVLVAESALR